MASADAKAAGQSGRGMLPLSLFILVAGIALSAASFWFVERNVLNEAKLKFESRASDSHAALAAHITSYTDILFGLRALFHSSDWVSRRQFHSYVASIDLTRFPGVLVLNYAEHVPAKGKSRFEAKIRNDRSLDPAGMPGFQIKPPGARPFYHVLTYVEPMRGNEVAIGRDILMQPGRKETFDTLIKQLSSSAGLWSTGRPVVIEGPNRHWAIAMRLPVYGPNASIETPEDRRAALLGTLGAGFRVGALMANVLNAKTLEGLRFKVYDAGPVKDQAGAAPAAPADRLLLFDSRGAPDSVPDQDANTKEQSATGRDVLTTVLPLPLAGRMWEVEYSAPVNSFASSGDIALPWLILVGGVVISFLLFGMAYSLASSRGRAVKLARDITRDLRESEASLAESQRMAHLGNWTLDLESRTMEWSAETFRILRLELKSEATYYEFVRWIHPDDRQTVENALAEDGVTHRQDELEYRLAFPDGTLSWVHVLIRPDFDKATMLRGTIMDITDRQRAAEELRTYADQLRSVSRRLLEVQETERRLLASELHDRVGQSLTALGLNLSIVEKLIDTAAQPGLKARLADSSSLVEQTMDSMRNVMGELRPQGLDDYGLIAPLRAFATGFSQRTGIRVELHAAGATSRVRDTVALAMFRIAQEALNNIAKHSKAKLVEISYVEANSRATLTISDDGVGFDLRAGGKTGWGLMIMKERAEAAGARFAMDASRGGGTRVVVDYVFSPGDVKVTEEA